MGPGARSMIEVVGAVAAWLGDPASWTGSGGIPYRIGEHLVLAGLATMLAFLAGGPIGMVIGHTGRGAVLAVSVANLGRSVPSYALLIVFVAFLGIGFANALAVLVLLGIPPILVNTYAGIQAVDRDLVEAARGMGMTGLGVLRRVELPLALPVIVAGTRVAAVQIVATATLYALVGGGGLGRYIVDGFALRRTGPQVGGAILVALLALVTERAFTLAERRLGGSRTARGGGPSPGGDRRAAPGATPA